MITAEDLVYEALVHLAGGRVFPDIAPQNSETPYITYQAVGGVPINFLTGETPAKQKVRMQVNVWASEQDGRVAVSELGKQVEDSLRSATDLQTEVINGRAATYDEHTNYRGTLQDFYLFC
jgi:hypothetical protein